MEKEALLREVLVRIENKEFFEKIVMIAYEGTMNDHPYYKMKPHEAMSLVKRFTGQYYTLLTNGEFSITK